MSHGNANAVGDFENSTRRCSSTDADRFVESRSKKAPLRPPQRHSLRRSVDAMCRECIYDSHAGGGWRQQVAACTSSGCPLHPVRPLPPGARQNERS